MNDFLIGCSFKSYSKGPKFDQLSQRYAILSHAMRHSAGLHKLVFIQTLYCTGTKSPARYSIERLFFSEFENILGHDSGT
jgi:hypothetical protein